MKKIVSLLVIVFCAIGLASAQTVNMAAWKEAKKEAKMLEKQGWTLTNPGDLAQYMYAHLELERSPKYFSVMGDATTSMVTLAEDQAKVDALQQANDILVAKAKANGSLKATPGAKYMVDGLDRCMRYSFTIIRFENGGYTACRVYYLLDEEAAAKCEIVEAE